MNPWTKSLIVLTLAALFSLLAVQGAARPPIRASFFDVYPNALDTQLDDLPSDSRHCGVCHFDFSGGGARNPYGLAIEIGLGQGMTDEQAVQAIAALDTDGDGFSNDTEITSTAFSNTPTFPGLTTGNVASTSAIPLTEITPYLTPTGGTDTEAPVVTLFSPAGGEVLQGGAYTVVSYQATDNVGVVSVDLYLSDDGGTTLQPMLLDVIPGPTITWFVPNLPGTANRIRVVARDLAGNSGLDESATNVTILPVAGGIVATTLRDMKLPGSQPLGGVQVDDPADCFTCHAGYDVDHEPGRLWEGSAMAQAARDPLFFAAVAIAEQDAPSSGDLCLRCHTPGGWLEGRSVDTSGGMLTALDREGVQCDACHRMVDPHYTAGVSPPQDSTLLAGLALPPTTNSNGSFVLDPSPLRRGPFADAAASHDFVESPFHRESAICGTCHDVSNPVFEATGQPGDYAPGTLNAQHVDMDLRNMFPIERTFSEWSISEYATLGVYAPQFAGNKADGIVGSCQDCHMADAQAKGCNDNGAPTREDMPMHDFMGGNTFLAAILPGLFPGEVDATVLNEAADRARSMLSLAATLDVTPQPYGMDVRVTNETGHKLPSGYPEGRRIWIQVTAKDAGGQTVFTSGAYDAGTGELTHDAQLKLYEIHPGLSDGLAGALGLTAGPSFHFVLNDTVLLDNRIPPRGYTLSAFTAIQSPPVGVTYPDGQYWDDSQYTLPVSADSATVTLLYQTTTKEYVEFLRDENVTNTAGQTLYDAWVASGRAPPVVMASTTVLVNVSVTSVPEVVPVEPFRLAAPAPNPSRGATTLAYSQPHPARVRLEVFDVAGRSVIRLVDEDRPAGTETVTWDGRDQNGRRVAAGLFFVRLESEERVAVQRILRLP